MSTIEIIIATISGIVTIFGLVEIIFGHPWEPGEAMFFTPGQVILKYFKRSKKLE